ncbi:MAG: spore cortex biosynthesis protein YabQ [Defluviitaleaceae bacterium]|nr:spore cortex biosynthesis protein YabQ [Defluviitaleaceae bacterium]
MILSMTGQAWLFLSTVIVGAAIGLFYDAFRVLRKTARHNKLAVTLEDLFFWVTATGLTFYYMLHRSYGEIRLFTLLGIACGILLYFATVSRWVVVVLVAVVNYLKRVVTTVVRILLVPLRLVAAWLSRPLGWLFGMTRKHARRVKRYGKGKLRVAARDFGIVRKKV